MKHCFLRAHRLQLRRPKRYSVGLVLVEPRVHGSEFKGPWGPVFKGPRRLCTRAALQDLLLPRLTCSQLSVSTVRPSPGYPNAGAPGSSVSRVRPTRTVTLPPPCISLHLCPSYFRGLECALHLLESFKAQLRCLLNRVFQLSLRHTGFLHA